MDIPTIMLRFSVIWLSCFTLVYGASIFDAREGFELSIIHINDFHASEINKGHIKNSDPCYVLTNHYEVVSESVKILNGAHPGTIYNGMTNLGIKQNHVILVLSYTADKLNLLEHPEEKNPKLKYLAIFVPKGPARKNLEIVGSDALLLSVVVQDYTVVLKPAFEETDTYSLTCSNKATKCIGGYSRLYSMIWKLKEEVPASIVLNAGDTFQGTLWYTIHKWNAIQHFMNMIPFDAHTLGNHEFDDKLSGVVPYLQNLKAPTVVANIDDSEEPTIHGLYKKSFIVERDSLRIGIIGVIVSNTDQLARTEKLKFLDEIISVNREAERLVSEDIVDTIIVLSHCGYEIEKKIAENAAPKIGLIVGGHSHTLLFTGTPPDGFVAAGEYPTIVRHSDGRKVLVVQASAYTKFLGHIKVKYNVNGDVESWSGAPIYLDSPVSQDLEINDELSGWKQSIDEFGSIILGTTSVYLDGRSCYNAECNLGNFITDAMVYAFVDSNEDNAWTYASIGLVNCGGIRTSLNTGNITVGHLLEAQPFQNTFDAAELQGKYLKEALEFSARPFGSRDGVGLSLLQVSGIRVVYNISKEIGSRVESLKVRCRECHIPKYENIEMDKYYRIASSSYVMSGKDGFNMISDNIVNHKIGESEGEVLGRYIKLNSPITQSIEGRITVVE